MKLKALTPIVIFQLLTLFLLSSPLLLGKTYSIKSILSVNVDSSINPATLSYLQSAYKKAEEKKNTALLIKLDTPGGLVSTTKSILTLMGKSSVPTIIWITPEGASATSAGAIISSGAHFLFMSQGTNIGAATPVQMGKDIPKDLRNKAINDLVALVSSLSVARGRNSKLFAEMIKTAKSYQAEKALKQKIINGITNDLDSVLKSINHKSFSLKGKKYQIKLESPKLIEFSMDLGQSLLNILANPNMAYILFLIGAALIYFEFQAPGTIIPGAAGALCLILAGIGFQVLPLNFGALGLIILAFVFFIAEVFVASYGLLSVAGICALVFGSLFLFRTDDSYMNISQDLILACALGIGLFLFAMGLYIIWDRKTHKKPKNIYTEKGKEALVIKALGFNHQQKTYHYLVRVDGEIWQASSNQDYEKGQVCQVLESFKENMKLKI